QLKNDGARATMQRIATALRRGHPGLALARTVMSHDLVQGDGVAADAAAVPVRIVDWLAIVWSVGLHVLALLIFVPWFFSWTGVVLLIVGIHVFGMIGINLGYHRLLTHRSFSCPRWLEYTLATLGVCCVHEAPARWVSIHRRHHQFADKED